MEGKTDGVAEAAKKVREVAESFLPGRPHHLALNKNRKYAPPAGFWFTGQSSRLQYMTNLSEADRGMLMTVPFFEIIDEPEPNEKTPAKVAQKGEAKKKISMKDYKARRKSTSPTDGDPSVKTDAKQGAAAADTSAPKEKEKEKEESHESRPKETNGHPVVKHERTPEKPRPEQNGDRSASQSKNEAKNAPSQDTRKRPPDTDENNAPPKKLKANDGIPVVERLGEERSSTQRSRDAPKDKPSSKEPRDARDSRDTKEAKDPRDSRDARDARDSKESRGAKDAKAPASSATSNGRLQVSSDRDRDLSSPRSTIMVNGGASRAGSSTSTPRKGDKGDSLKANIIPPLLSPPLHMDANDDLPSPRKKPAGKAPLKGPRPTGHSRTNSATKAPLPELLSPIHIGADDEHESPAKKLQEKNKAKVPPSSKPPKRPNPKSMIPPLLSPTLPAIVEDDLERYPVKLVALPQPAAGDAKKPKSKTLPESRPSDAKAPERKALPEPKRRPEEASSTRSKIVVLKVRKSLRARVQAILSLPSKSRREALRKERSASVERTPPARKRPLPAADSASDLPSSKRSRPSTDALPPKLAAPTTPLKTTTSTSMMRVLSNTSQANTPGDSTTLTPGAAERPPTSSAAETNAPNLDPATLARIAAARDRHLKLSKLGTKLKHTRDAIIRNTNRAPTETEQKRCAALHFEMILSYMVSFKANNTWHQLERKPLEVPMWETLLPHFVELRSRVRTSRPLLALAAHIHAVCLEEYCQAFMTLDERSVGKLYPRWAHHAKKRRDIWEEAHMLNGKVEETKMKVNFGPWTSTDDAVSSALLIIRRWAQGEGVDWKAELDMPSST